MDDSEDLLAFPPVMAPHPIDMPLEEASLDERSECVLLEHRDRAGVKRQLPVEPLGQFGRQNHVADTDSRSQGFRERIHVDDAPGGIDALKRRQWAALYAEFAVIVVLDDIARGILIGPGQQFIAAADRHRDAGREMVVRADMRDLGTHGFERVHTDTLCIHAGPHAWHTLVTVDLQEFAVARVFDAVDVIPAEQLDEQAVEILRPCSHENLCRIHSHAAERSQMTGNSRPQLLHATARRWHEQLLTPRRQHLACQARPDGKREIPRIGVVGRKIEYGRRLYRRIPCK